MMTYVGFLKIIFTSQSETANKFIKWATEIFDKDTSSLLVVYFYTLGNVKSLRKSMNIDKKYGDNDIVGMYGLTKNVSRRTKENIKAYNKIKGCDLKMKMYSYVDPQS